MTNTVRKTFKLHPDQYEIVEAALKLCKKKSGTEHDTAALEYIAQEFMGTSMGFATLKAGLLAERRKSTSFEDFLGTLAGLLDPMADAEDLVISISTEPKA